MIATVSLHDIVNCEAFVGNTITRSRIRMTPDERQEMLCEGLVILTELAARYQPHMDGYATSGRFSGFAAQLLPRRLQDAWDRMHPEHQQSRDRDGRRVYTYNPPPMSIFTEDFGELHATAALGNPTQTLDTFGPLVDRGLNTLPAWHRFAARRVIQLIDEGYSTDEIAGRLGIGRKDVTRLQSHTASAIAGIQQQEAE